jgi:hypothetical protein
MLFEVFAGGGDTDYFGLEFGINNRLALGGGVTTWRQSTQVFRDLASFYHIVIAVDTTQATPANRIKVYVNGVEITAWSINSNPTQNADTAINSTSSHKIGNGTGGYYNGYMTEINFIDGQALTPSSFGETNATTGVWSPIAYAGSYGTNGFYLNFSDNSDVTATTLGKDQAGSNNWTPNNFSVTAGAGNDSLVDSPMQYGTDTGAGGEVRGNYATWNPLVKVVSQPTFSNGNLVSTTPADWSSAVGTIGLTSGKWYWEIVNGNSDAFVGIVGSNANLGADLPQNATGTILYYGNTGNKRIDSVDTAYGSAFSTQVIGVALDIDGGTVVFYRDNVSQGSISLSSSTLNGKTIFPLSGVISTTATANFGQRPFAYTAPSGFKALVTTNLPEPTIVDGSQYFDAVTYSGTGATQTITVDFASDFAWLKRRDGVGANVLLDILRLTGSLPNRLFSNLTDAESTTADGQNSFSSTGIVLDGTGGGGGDVNTSGRTYVAWQWKANGAGVSNTDGTIPGTVTVSANTTAGISIVTYTGSSASTVGHGLGVAPAMIIAKQRNNVEHWVIYHQATGKDAVLLFTTNAVISSANYWGSGGVTSTVFGTGGVGAGNAANNIVAYCFAEVEGFSKFGSYTGNGSADGPFVYTGFRPAFVLGKDSSSTNNWFIFDSVRDTYNVAGKILRPNLSDAELDSPPRIDLLSNGFKVRSTALPNDSGETYIYAAFAENPFKYSLAR